MHCAKLWALKKENSAGEINSNKNGIRKLYSCMSGFEEGREYKIYSVKKIIMMISLFIVVIF
jgi:hypothetical protein